MLNLKEVVVKAELNEMKLRESQNKLKTMEYQLLESEQQNECLIVSSKPCLNGHLIEFMGVC